MPRRFTRRLVAPINSVKHYVQVSLSPIASGTAVDIPLVVAVESVAASATEVQEGAVIKAIFIEMWIKADGATGGTALFSLIKRGGTGVDITFGQSTALQDFADKKNVFYHTQGLTNIATGVATPFIRTWFKIPKGKQRFGLGDKLYLNVSSQTEGHLICGFATYKEYR